MNHILTFVLFKVIEKQIYDTINPRQFPSCNESPNTI